MKSLKKIIMACLLGLMLAVSAVTITEAVTPVQVSAATVTEAKLNKKLDAIIKKNTKTSDTDAVKLKKLFTYVRKNYVYGRDVNRLGVIPSKAGWTTTYAYEMLTDKKGDCYHFAALYATLANRATGLKTRAVVGQTVGFDKARKSSQSHAWTEVKINGKWYVFDTNLDLYGKTVKGKTVAANTYFNKLRTSAAMKKIYCNFKGAKLFSL